MKRREAPSADEARQIDATYGLEPVFDPGQPQNAASAAGATPGGSELRLVQCPYCGESFETLIDLSAGSATYIEDCQICCQPIEFRLEVDHEGALATLATMRGD
jgi:hypothetical protein